MEFLIFSHLLNGKKRQFPMILLNRLEVININALIDEVGSKNGSRR